MKYFASAPFEKEEKLSIY